MSSRQALLALFAHPDDESYRAGGLLALLARSGVQVQVLTATRGEAGLPAGYAPEALYSVREKELNCACQALHLLPPLVWDYPDGRLAECEPEMLIQRILFIAQEIQPQVMLSFGPDGLSGHPDHIAIGKAAAAAFTRYREAGALYQLAVPVSLAQGLGMDQVRAVADSKITLAVDVTPVWEAKMKAIHCHATQVTSSPILSQTEDRQRRFLGVEHFVRAAITDQTLDFIPDLLRKCVL